MENGRLDIRHLIIDPGEGPLQANGLSVVARHLAHEQKQAGHAASLVYLCRTPRNDAEVSDVPSRVLPLNGTGIRGRVIRLDPQVTESLLAGAGTDTVFHIHHGRDPVLLPLTAELRRRRIPYALMIHGRYSHVFDAENRIARMLPALYLMLVERRVMERAAFVHTITPAEQAIVRRLAPQAACELIPNAAFSSRIDGAPTPPTRCAPSARFPLFGFCGRYAIEHKGLDLLLEGLADYRRAGGRGSLELVGSGPAREELIRMAKSLAIESSCQVNGPMFGEDKKRTMRTWDFFALPSRFDGLPTAGLEAALLGLPLLASKGSGLQDHVVRAQCGVPIDALTPQAVSQAMMRAEQVSTDEWVRQSQAAFRMAVAMGDWTEIADRVVRLYRRPRA